MLPGLTAMARAFVRELDASDDLQFLRVRGARHEILVAPSCVLVWFGLVCLCCCCCFIGVPVCCCRPLHMYSPPTTPTCSSSKTKEDEFVLVVLQEPLAH
jgi:hypothetical protein